MMNGGWSLTNEIYPYLHGAPAMRAHFDLLTDDELALMVGVTINTLADWRSEDKGPSYTKLGQAVFYRVDDVKRWIDCSVVHVPAGPKLPPGYVTPLPAGYVTMIPDDWRVGKPPGAF